MKQGLNLEVAKGESPYDSRGLTASRIEGIIDTPLGLVSASSLSLFRMPVGLLPLWASMGLTAIHHRRVGLPTGKQRLSTVHMASTTGAIAHGSGSGCFRRSSVHVMGLFSVTSHPQDRGLAQQLRSKFAFTVARVSCGQRATMSLEIPFVRLEFSSFAASHHSTCC
jgi:hypothetical protein